MFKKISQTIFSIIFLFMLIVPLVTTNLQKDKISEAENRKLTNMAELYKEDGTLNENFADDFEIWLNDNIGQRSKMVIDNAKIQYYLFKVLANNSDMYLGPNDELNYATEDMLKDYQHVNLYSENHLVAIADSMQYLSNYVKSKGAQFYYYQCWDKYSIYPKYFPDTVFNTGMNQKQMVS